MKMKKLVSLVLTLAMLCGLLSGMNLSPVSAAELTESFVASRSTTIGIDAKNHYRNTNWIVLYVYGFDAKVDCTESGDWVQDALYTGPNHTATNQYGIEVAVNQFGIVTAIEDGKGNMEIPFNGYVLSANGTKAAELRGYVANGQLMVGDYMRTNDNVTFAAHRTNADSQFTHVTGNFKVSHKITKLKADDYDVDLVTITNGGDGITTGSSEWSNDVLIKATGTGADGAANHQGYVVKVGGNNISVPAGYFAISFIGQQTTNDKGQDTYNGAYLFKHYAAPGTLVDVGADEVYFRYDAAAAVRGAYLLTGMTNNNINVTDVYDFSAAAILNDAKTNYELVDTDRMQELYNNMVEVANILNNSGFTEKAEVEQYHATINQNYAELCKLEFETRTVEMRAVWMTPLERNDRNEYTAEELDALLEEQILHFKSMGYNMIFFEAFGNSVTVFPVPESTAHNGLQFRQNPWLVPTSMGGENSNLTEPYDMLQRFIDICRENDMEPHIWWEVFYVGYTRTDPVTYTDSLFEYSVAQAIMDNPDKYANWLNQAQNGDLYYGAATDGAHQYFLNPGSTGARTLLMNLFEHVWATYDAESFQLDYIRYPHTNSSKNFGYDSDTIAAFLAEYPAYTEAQLRDSANFWNEDWVNFRAKYVTTFVEEIRAKMKENNPGMYLTASPGADPAGSKKDLMQDVTYWLTNDLIDIIFPMAYGENIPGNVSETLVKDNLRHFVCTGVSGSYLNDAMEQRWMKEIRDAGADGLAAFGEIPEYVDYVWSKEAVTPTGNAANAACVYVNDTVIARADQMLKLGGITEAQCASIKAAAVTLIDTLNRYGIDGDEALAAINALQTVVETLPENPKAALTKDLDYLGKIRDNSRDTVKQEREVNKENFTLTVNGTAVKDGGEDFTYVSSVNRLYITKNNTVLSGSIPSDVIVIAEDNVSALELSGLAMTADSDFAIDTTVDLTVELTGTNVVTASGALSETTCTFIGTGELYNGDELVLRKGDVVTSDGLDELNTKDIRELIKYNVKAATLTDEQFSLADANGDGKVNTIDTRMFLDVVTDEAF